MGGEQARLVDRTAPDGTVTLVVEGTEPLAWAFTLEAYAALKNVALTALSFLDADKAKTDAKDAAAEENAKAPPPMPDPPTPIDPKKLEAAPLPPVGPDGIPESIRSPPSPPTGPRALAPEQVKSASLLVQVDKAKALTAPAEPVEQPKVLFTSQGPVVPAPTAAQAPAQPPPIELPDPPGSDASLAETTAYVRAAQAVLDLHRKTEVPLPERMARVHEGFDEYQKFQDAPANSLTRFVDDATAEVPVVADRLGQAELDAAGPNPGILDVVAATGTATVTEFLGGVVTFVPQAVVHPIDTTIGLASLPLDALHEGMAAADAPEGSDERWIKAAGAAKAAFSFLGLIGGTRAGASRLQSSLELRFRLREAQEAAAREATAREARRTENQAFVEDWNSLANPEGTVQYARPATAAELAEATRAAAQEAAAPEAAAETLTAERGGAKTNTADAAPAAQVDPSLLPPGWTLDVTGRVRDAQGRFARDPRAPLPEVGALPEGWSRDAAGRLRDAHGRFAALNKHGNTAGSQPAVLYRRYADDGTFLKWGVTDNLATRYTRGELAGGWLEIEAVGPRWRMLELERDFVETSPGPMNHESWAGKRGSGVPTDD